MGQRASSSETTNLAGLPESPDTERELKDRLLTWTLETSDVIPWRRDPRMDDDLRSAFAGRPSQGATRP